MLWLEDSLRVQMKFLLVHCLVFASAVTFLNYVVVKM